VKAPTTVEDASERKPPVRKETPETEMEVEVAYGKMEATVVEVATT
jgi:hypothetical protein